MTYKDAKGCLPGVTLDEPTEIDRLLTRLERAYDLTFLVGVPVLVRANDVFTLVEWVKSLTAERDVLKSTVEAIEFGHEVVNGRANGYMMSAGELREFARRELDKLYAPKNEQITYPTRQE